MPQLERLGPEHEALVRGFVCTKHTGERLVRFLQERALAEQEALCSSTFVLPSEDGTRIDAYVTVSMSTFALPQPVRRKKNIPRSTVPAVLLGFIAVHDLAPRGTGREIFDWLKLETFKLNATAGVRVIWLEVEAENWRAFQNYVAGWGMTAVPLKDPKDPTGQNVRLPNPTLKSRPPNIAPEERIALFYDLFDQYGPWPAEGLPETR